MELHTMMKTTYEFNIDEKERGTLIDLSTILMQLRHLFERQNSCAFEEYLQWNYESLDSFILKLANEPENTIAKILEYIDNHF